MAAASRKRSKSPFFLYLIIGIVLAELAVTVGAIVISITNAEPSSTGVPHFRFPWLGYLVAVVMVPALAMLLVNLVSLGFSRDARGGEADLEGVPQRLQTFYALVRGAPTVILFRGFASMGAAIYYLDGVMALLLKLGNISIWWPSGLSAALRRRGPSTTLCGRGCTTRRARWKRNTPSATRRSNARVWSFWIPNTRPRPTCGCSPPSPAHPAARPRCPRGRDRPARLSGKLAGRGRAHVRGRNGSPARGRIRARIPQRIRGKHLHSKRKKAKRRRPPFLPRKEKAASLSPPERPPAQSHSPSRARSLPV
ncbi:MAG: hypothetical protein V8Q84_00255 [Bilophila sp.]